MVPLAFGQHKENGKEYHWRVCQRLLQKGISISPGDTVLVNTKNGKCLVHVTRVGLIEQKESLKYRCIVAKHRNVSFATMEERRAGKKQGQKIANSTTAESRVARRKAKKQRKKLAKMIARQAAQGVNLENEAKEQPKTQGEAADEKQNHT